MIISQDESLGPLGSASKKAHTIGCIRQGKGIFYLIGHFIRRFFLRVNWNSLAASKYRMHRRVNR